MSVRILHTADLHLGSRMASLGERADDFREALLRSFERQLALAAEHEVAALLIAGDFLEMNEIREREVHRIADMMRRTRPFHILIAAGNHDPYSAASHYAEALSDLPKTHIFAPNVTERVDFPSHDLSVYGTSFGSLYQSETLLPIPGRETAVYVADDDEQYRVADREPCVNRIGMVHGTVLGGTRPLNPEPESYNPLYGSECDRLPLAYLALGHIHKPSERFDPGAGTASVPALYPGSPQGLSFNEPGARHALLAEFSDNRLSRLEAVPTSDRLFLDLSVTLSKDDSDEDVTRAVLAAAHDAAGGEPARHAFRITLVGDCPQNFDIRSIEASLAYDLGFFRLRDALKLPLDLDRIREEPTLVGRFVSQLLDQYEAADDEIEREDLMRAIRIGLEAFEGEILYHVD